MPVITNTTNGVTKRITATPIPRANGDGPPARFAPAYTQ